MDNAPPLDLHARQWYGIRFDIPLPLVLLGRTFGITAAHPSAILRLDFDQHSYPPDLQHRFQEITFRPGVVFPRDRFGFCGYTRVTIRIRTSLDILFKDAIFETLGNESEPTKIMIRSGKNLRPWCCDLVNKVIDSYSVTHSQFWIHSMTPDDMWKIELTDYGTDADGEGQLLTFGIGVPGYQMQFAAADTFNTLDTEKLVERIAARWKPWEKLLLQASRYQEVGDYIAAGLSMCLAFEVFINQLLDENSGRVSRAVPEDAGLNVKCTKYLNGLIGGSLESSVHGQYAKTYAQLRALRNTLMHRGSTRYEWRTPAGILCDSGDISSQVECQKHVRMVSELIDYVSKRAAA
jgi:hypothetical protein